MIVLDNEKYHEICSYMRRYKRLAIDCEASLVKKFPDVPRLTLASLLQHDRQLRLRQMHARVNARAAEHLAEYRRRVSTDAGKTLLKMALEMDFSPISLARIIVSAAYPDFPKPDISKMMHNIDTIPDPQLALNVCHCILNDNQEGAIADAARRCIGEEYEIRLKEMARNAGMVFYDEGDLRREGYDKTPDLKMAVPFLYKGMVVNWIESKALFGDHEAHKRYMNDQLTSYVNRFGPGIVIYWLGFLDDIRYHKENDEHIVILHSFPEASEMEFLSYGKESAENKANCT
ncbi:CDAN1-interacting nuclease 1 [Culicoides brevitarsis]|uniref:CDAN1-interacting nuclease 1 n=1 Tax=Culicoides brevitarsis TaxID=469753 RepID=UPI00307C0CEA